MTRSGLKVRNTKTLRESPTARDEPVYPRRKWSDALARAGDRRAWFVSLLFHLGLLILLGSVTYVASVEFRAPEIDSTVAPQKVDRQFETVLSADAIGNQSDMQTDSNSAAVAEFSGESSRTNFVKPQQTVTESDFRLPEVVEEISLAELSQRIDIRGESSQMVGGVDGALDRLVAEIRQSLEERKTLVIWLFDASGSLKKRRSAIADRFESIYAQLGELQQSNDPPLKTVVASFGKSYQFLTDKPVDDVTDSVTAIRNIEMDDSGEEQVFSAVSAAAKKYYKYRTRAGYNIMQVIVTDERGDDEQLLDGAIQFNRRYGIRTYCIGNASMFGRELGYVTWTYSDNSTKEFPVKQGPETAMAERLRLSFWGGRGVGRISSGHGPYALTRLCAETGGLYLIPDDVRGAKFDPAIMRSYQPDYLSRAEYERRLKQNRAKGALVRAAALTRDEREGVIRVPRTAFRADNDTILRRQMTDAQKPMAKLTYQLDQLLMLLEVGEKDRAKVNEPRWRAGYDLAMGRALAMKVRSLGYNSVLAEMKSQPKKFSDPTSDQWVLAPSEKIISGARVKKLADKARMYLTRVVDEHPRTPWGLLAERELSQPLGWEWKERTVGYAQIEQRQRQQQNQPPPDDQARQRRAQIQRDGPKGL